MPVVYVDSGSTDGSRELGSLLGAEVVELDLSRPFNAARARNAGFARLTELAPNANYVQFVDGDCEVAPGWLGAAASFLRQRLEVAAVCGRRRERYPERSVYNLLCDLEWDTPVGATKACGGDVLMRATAFHDVGGFREDLIAGEEPELCVRLRSAGWKIWRIDQEMTRHDIALRSFAQWWTRSVRSRFFTLCGSPKSAYQHSPGCIGSLSPSTMKSVSALVVIGIWRRKNPSAYEDAGSRCS
jgi:GT2 family glycosyltransferase